MLTREARRVFRILRGQKYIGIQHKHCELEVEVSPFYYSSLCRYVRATFHCMPSNWGRRLSAALTDYNFGDMVIVALNYGRLPRTRFKAQILTDEMQWKTQPTTDKPTYAQHHPTPHCSGRD